MTSFLMRALIVCGLLASYPLARVLAPQAGWENGLIENIQLMVLAAGMLVASINALIAPTKRQRWFWLMLAPLWAVMLARELSWGAAMLMEALFIHPQTGPVYSSSLQLAYKPLIYPAVILILVLVLLVFGVTRQYKTLGELWHNKAIPWFEMVMAIGAVALSMNAEGNVFLSLIHYQKLNSKCLKNCLNAWGIFAFLPGHGLWPA